MEKYQDGVKLLAFRGVGSQKRTGSNLGLQNKNRCVKVSVEASLKVINNELQS